MRKTVLWAWIALFFSACLTAAIILFPEVLGQSGHDARQNLYEFQGLVAGGLAVAAAVFTVTQMESTERKASQRHEETKRLSLRGDKLRIERALYPQQREVRASVAKLSELKEEVERRIGSLDHKGSPFNGDVAFRVWTETSAIADIFARPHFLEGALLFGGELNHLVWEFRQTVGAALTASKRSAQYFDRMDIDYEADFSYSCWVDEGGEDRIIEFLRYCGPAFFAIDKAMTELDLQSRRWVEG